MLEVLDFVAIRCHYTAVWYLDLMNSAHPAAIQVFNPAV